MASFCSWFCSDKCGRGLRTGYHLCVSDVIKSMRKRGKSKISLSNPRGGKIFNSTASGRESMGGERRGREGYFKSGGMVKLRVHGISNCRRVLKLFEELGT